MTGYRMTASSTRPPTPFTVIGGFLGAGKTTLVNRLLSASDAPRCAVLVNDFGAIAVDESLIESHGGETIALKNGCVCCTIGDDLGRAIAAALDFAPPLAHIVVEASGVAHPGKIADVARIAGELKPGGVFVLADAAEVRAQLADRWIADTVHGQFQAAGCIVVSKLNLLSPPAQIAALQLLANRYPSRELLLAEENELDAIINRNHRAKRNAIAGKPRPFRRPHHTIRHRNQSAKTNRVGGE